MNVERSGRIQRSSALDATAGIGVSGLHLVFLAVTGVLLARAFGPAGKGVVTLVIVIAQRATYSLSLGVESALVHFGGRKGWTPGALMRSALLLGVLLGGLASAVAGVLMWTVFSDDIGAGVQMWTLAIIATVPAIAVVFFVGSVLQFTGRLIEVNVVGLAGAVLNTAAAAVVLAMGWGPGIYLLLAGVSLVVQVFAVLVLARRSGLGVDRGSGRHRDLVAFGVRGHLGTIFQSVNDRLDVLIIALLLSVSDVGVYSVAVSAAEMLIFVPHALGFVVLQRVAVGTDRQAAEFTGASSRLSSAVMALGAIVLGLLAEPLIRLVFGPRFVSAAMATVLLLPGVWALGQWRVIAQALAGHGYPAARSISAAVGAVLTVVLDLVLIPRYGIEGAAIASSVAYVSSFLVIASIARKRFGPELGGMVVPHKRDVGLVVAAFRSFARSPRPSGTTSEP